MHEFAKNTRIASLNAFGTALAVAKYPLSGSFISVEPFPWHVFVVTVGTLDSALTLQLQQDTSATQTGDIKNVTGAVLSIGAGDDNDVFVLEIEAMAALDLTEFTHITLNVTGPAAANDFASIVHYGCHAKIKPVTQPATTLGNIVVVAG